jgi:hypothetical protein
MLPRNVPVSVSLFRWMIDMKNLEVRSGEGGIDAARFAVELAGAIES